jgi:hypothetical protein
MQVIFKNTPHNRKFGVELEVSPNIHKSQIGVMLEDYEMFYGTARPVVVTPEKTGWAFTNGNSYWHVKYDSTCGPIGKPHDYGWEVASFIGKTEDDLDVISGAGDWLADHGVKTNNNCGYHIHVDVSDFTSENMAILLARWLKIEFFVMSACASRRINNPYCQLLNMRKITENAYYNPDSLVKFWDRMAPHNLGVHDNMDKRYTVNTIGFRLGQINHSYTRKTVEFRFPECLLSGAHIGNWVRLLLCFVEESYKSKPPESIQKSSSLSETLQILGLQGSDSFYLLEPKLSDTKIWFLQKIIAESGKSSYAEEAQELLAFILEM